MHNAPRLDFEVWPILFLFVKSRSEFRVVLTAFVVDGETHHLISIIINIVNIVCFLVGNHLAKMDLS